jgi:hypothetical protein
MTRATDKSRREAFERLRSDVQKSVGGRVSSEQVHREIADIARREDRKDSEKGGK